MSDKANKVVELLHQPAMEKLRNGSCAHFADFIEGLATEANKSNAGRASVTFSFNTDDEHINAKYVPQVSVTVHTPAD